MQNSVGVTAGHFELISTSPQAELLSCKNNIDQLWLPHVGVEFVEEKSSLVQPSSLLNNLIFLPASFPQPIKIIHIIHNHSV